MAIKGWEFLEKELSEFRKVQEKWRDLDFFRTDREALEKASKQYREALAPFEKTANAVEASISALAFDKSTFKYPEAFILPPVAKLGPIDPELASDMHKRLVRRIAGFEQTLDQAHEVGVHLVNFGAVMTIHLRAIGYSNPSLIVFYGESESGDPVELIQHISQVNLALVKVRRQDQNQSRAPIGFGPHSN